MIMMIFPPITVYFFNGYSPSLLNLFFVFLVSKYKTLEDKIIFVLHYFWDLIRYSTYFAFALSCYACSFILKIAKYF